MSLRGSQKTGAPARAALLGATSWRMRATAALLALALAAIGFAAASPEVHDHVHAGSDHPDHLCAITLAAIGFCDTSAAPPHVAVDRALIVIFSPSAHTYAWSQPAYWLIPAQAPPGRPA